MEWIDQLKAVEIIVGLLFAVISCGGGAVIWVGRQVRRTAKDVTVQIASKQQKTASQITTVKQQVEGLHRDFASRSGRVAHTERQLETVARSSDVTDLRREISEVASMASGTAAVTRSMAGQVDTLLRAAIAASEK